MAPKRGNSGGYGTPGLKQALAAVKKLESQMGREANADYAIALSASNAALKNLKGFTGRIEKQMLRDVLRSQKQLGTLTYNSKMTQRRVRASEARSVSRYGQALGQAVNAVYAPAQAVADSSVLMQRGAEIAGVKGGRAAETVAALAQSNVSAMNASARYALAQALQQRSIIDSGTIAQLTGQLYQSAIEFNQQKKLMEYEHKLAEKAAEVGGEKATALAIMDDGAIITADAADAYRTWYDENFEDPEAKFNITAAATSWAEENGRTPEEVAVYVAVLQGIKSGKNAPTAYSDAMEKLYGSSKGWERWGEPALAAGASKVQMEAAARRAEYLNTAPTDESFGVDNPDNPNRTNEGAIRTAAASLRAQGKSTDDIRYELTDRGYDTNIIEYVLNTGG